MKFASRLFALFILLLMGCSPSPDDGGTPQLRRNPAQQPTEANEQTTPLPEVEPSRRPASTQQPTPSPRPTRTPTPTQTPLPPDWKILAPGVAETYIPVANPATEQINYIYTLRLNPEAVAIQVFYDSEEPKSIDEWQQATGAGIVLNGGFFSGEHKPIGRIIIDGSLYGGPLNNGGLYDEDSVGVAGMFSVIDGQVGLDTIGREEFNPRELRFDYAVEAYPMLLLPGNQPGFPEETGFVARRTVIAIDRDGNVIILISDAPIFTLHQMGLWLAQSPLNLDMALNLDGGRSTGLRLAVTGASRHFPAYVPLPIVIAVYTR